MNISMVSARPLNKFGLRAGSPAKIFFFHGFHVLYSKRNSFSRDNLPWGVYSSRLSKRRAEYPVVLGLRRLPLLYNKSLFQIIYPGYLWARDKMWLLSRVQRLAGPAGGQGPFVPVGSTNRDKRWAFCPGWWIKPGQKARVAFCPGWNHQPGQKAPILSRLVSPTGTKGPRPPRWPG